MTRLLPIVCCAAIALASSAAARTVTVDSLAGTNATVTVGLGEATEYLGLAYGNTDGYANPGVGWDAIASLAAVPAAGGTYAVTLPFDPLTNATYRYSRFVLAEHPFDTRLDYLPGNGKTYFDTGITNASTDSVEIAIRVSSFGSSYSGIFGARAGASEQNISTFCNNNWEVYVDFNSSNASTYRAAPTFPGGSGYAALDMTIAISAAERRVDAFRNGVAVSSTRGSAANSTACADEFVCPGSAYIFKVNGQPASGWATAGSGYGFGSCRIDRGGEAIADMVPVSLFVDGVRVGRIYDLVRGKFLDRGGELAEFDITGVSGVKARVTASAAQGYESSGFSDITVTGIDGVYISVTVRATAVQAAKPASASDKMIRLTIFRLLCSQNRPVPADAISKDSGILPNLLTGTQAHYRIVPYSICVGDTEIRRRDLAVGMGSGGFSHWCSKTSGTTAFSSCASGSDPPVRHSIPIPPRRLPPNHTCPLSLTISGSTGSGAPPTPRLTGVLRSDANKPRTSAENQRWPSDERQTGCLLSGSGPNGRNDKPRMPIALPRRRSCCIFPFSFRQRAAVNAAPPVSTQFPPART